MNARMVTATRLGFREQARRPLLLVLLIVLPFFFITRAIARTEPTPRLIGLPGGGQVLTTMKDGQAARTLIDDWLASFNMAMDSSFATLEAAERQSASGLEKLRAAVSGYLTELIGRLGHPVVLLEDKALRPEQQRAIIRRRDQAERRYRALVEEGIRDGSIGPCNPKIAVFALMGAINWVPKWYRPDGELSAAEVVEALVDLITSGLAARTRPARAKERLAVAS